MLGAASRAPYNNRKSCQDIKTISENIFRIQVGITFLFCFYKVYVLHYLSSSKRIYSNKEKYNKYGKI